MGNFDGITIRHAQAMPVGHRMWHWMAIMLTCGLWWPVYRAAKRAAGER